MTAEQELREAARLIRDRGWIKDAFERNNALCITAACAVARGVDYAFGPSREAIAYLRIVTGCDQEAKFNDGHCRTANDAIAALEIAADLAA